VSAGKQLGQPEAHYFRFFLSKWHPKDKKKKQQARERERERDRGIQREIEKEREMARG
jgi:hypothetical protein